MTTPSPVLEARLMLVKLPLLFFVLVRSPTKDTLTFRDVADARIIPWAWGVRDPEARAREIKSVSLNASLTIIDVGHERDGF